MSSMLQSEEDEQSRPKRGGIMNASDDDSNSLKSGDEFSPNIRKSSAKKQQLKRGMTGTKNQRRRQRKKEKKLAKKESE